MLWEKPLWPACTADEIRRKSWKSWVGRTFKAYLVQPPCNGRVLSNLILNISKDGASTISTDNVLQWNATFSLVPIVCHYFSPSDSRFIAKIWTSWTELVFYSCIENLLYSAICAGFPVQCTISLDVLLNWLTQFPSLLFLWRLCQDSCAPSKLSHSKKYICHSIFFMFGLCNCINDFSSSKHGMNELTKRLLFTWLSIFFMLDPCHIMGLRNHTDSWVYKSPVANGVVSRKVLTESLFQKG